MSKVRNIYNPRFKVRLNDNQLVNHFPNHYELTRKDLLVKNIKRFKGEMEIVTLHSGEKLELNQEIIPTTFILPLEYSLFLEEFTKSQHKKWILKPAGRSQGKGISLVTKYSMAKNIPTVINNFKAQVGSYKEIFIISKYLNSPMLISGKKFDLRLYVLVTNYNPLKVYRYREGFCRLCFEDYISVTGKGNPNDELFSHLTNVSFQKTSEKYNDIHGGKLPYTSFLQYFELNYGREKMKKLIKDIDRVYLTTLKAAQPVIVNDKHAFEMYGFDILIDENFTPWLIEVNASPSLSTTTKNDKLLKKNLINDLINLLMPSYWTVGKRQKGSSSCKEDKVGNWDLLYDESKDPLSTASGKYKKRVKRASSNYVYR